MFIPYISEKYLEYLNQTDNSESTIHSDYFYGNGYHIDYIDFGNDGSSYDDHTDDSHTDDHDDNYDYDDHTDWGKEYDDHDDY